MQHRLGAPLWHGLLLRLVWRLVWLLVWERLLKLPLPRASARVPERVRLEQRGKPLLPLVAAPVGLVPLLLLLRPLLLFVPRVVALLRPQPNALRELPDAAVRPVPQQLPALLREVLARELSLAHEALAARAELRPVPPLADAPVHVHPQDARGPELLGPMPLQLRAEAEPGWPDPREQAEELRLLPLGKGLASRLAQALEERLVVKQPRNAGEGELHGHAQVARVAEV